MKPRPFDTLFTRLFALLLVAMVISQLLALLLIYLLRDGPPPDAGYGPPPRPFEQPMSHWEMQRPPPPPSGLNPMTPPPIWHGPPSKLLLGQLLQLLAITATAWIGARIVARPIRRLADGATELGLNIDALPIEENGPEEMRVAARGFNRMQAQIRNQLDERARFLAAVSHDLRTPLTRLRLRLSQIDSEPELQKKMNADIAEMSTMLDATLNYLRGASVQEPWQSFDIQALLESLAEDAQERGEAVTVSGSAEPILAQPLLLRRCISNLIDNALQYGQSAELRLDESDDNIVIEVRDHGPGIPENRMNAVFEPFYRLESSRNRSTGGCGLGLAIARDAARRHGGDITLRNAPDGGLVARLSLPRKQNN